MDKPLGSIISDSLKLYFEVTHQITRNISVVGYFFIDTVKLCC